MIAWNLATRGGEPFVNFKLHSFDVKCSQKLVNLGTPFSFHNSDPKVIDTLFFLQVCAGILFSSSLCFSYFLGWGTLLWSFVNFKLHSFNEKCSQKRVNSGNLFLSTILTQKLLTECFLESVRLYSLLFLPLPFFFLWCLFGLPSAISCRNPYIEYGTSYIRQCNDCLKFGNSWGEPFGNFKFHSFNV